MKSNLISALLILALLPLTLTIHTLNNPTTEKHRDTMHHYQSIPPSQASDITNSINTITNAIQNNPPNVQVLPSSQIPPLNLTAATCSSFSSTDQQNLISQTSSAISQLTAVQNSINNMPFTGVTLKLQLDTQNELLYLNNLQTTLNSNCQISSLVTPTVYQSNIYSPNWILGNQTTDQLIKQYVDRSLKSQNVTNCPINAPFFNGTFCINCADPSGLFNMQTNQCTSCPAGTVYNMTTRNCVSVPTSAQPNATNPSGFNSIISNTPLSAQPNDVPCPTSTPFYNGSACIKCTNPLPYFNAATFICVSCTNSQIFNSSTNQCQNVASTPNATNPTGYPNLITGNASYVPHLNNSDIPCPTITPFWTGSTCINCSAPNNLFNYTAKNCTACPANSVYNVTIHQCQNTTLAPNATNPTGYPNLITSNASYVPQLNSTSIPCPTETPFWTGSTCINCTAPNNLFNHTAKNCTACPQNTFYNVTIHQCQNTSQNPNATNPTGYPNLVTPNASSVPQLNSSDIPCSTTAPFWTGNSCINCTAPTPLFNQTAKNCTACPQNTLYDVATHQCQPNQPNATAPSGFNRIITPNSSVAPSSNQTDVPCPDATPFWNGKSCINCTSPNSYFNLATSACISCASPNTYDPSSYQCLSLGNNNSVTSNSAPNLINDGYVTAYWQQVHDNITNQTGAKDCPAATPYYNGQTCINCSAPTPYFSLLYRKCENCATNYTYNATQRECLDSNGSPQSPNLLKMSGTVFTHAHQHAHQHARQHAHHILKAATLESGW